MKEYMKPVLLTSDELAEGVYLASGDGSGCYTTTAYIHQTPQTGRGDYRIQVNAVHNADHTKEAQQLNISFNQPVTYVSGGRGVHIRRRNKFSLCFFGISSESER